jgi:hypothetical protein
VSFLQVVACAPYQFIHLSGKEIMCAQTGSQTRQHPLSKGTEFDASLSASQTILRKPIETKVNFQYIETARAKKKHLQLNKRYKNLFRRF